MSDPHADSHELAYLSVATVKERFESGALTSRELVENALARIAAIDAPSTEIALRAVAALAADALETADERDRERASGVSRGLLHGIPILIKDNIEAIGLPGTAGCGSLVGRESRDAPLVQRLREAGAIVLGSTNLSEWANIRSPRSSSGWSATGGLVGNPWALDRSAGGSSSGSGAALAAGYVPLAVGTETDGSIVCPSSVNGVTGLKPTVGTVSTTYVVPISASQDSPGPMARCVDDVALLFRVLGDVAAPGPLPTPTFAQATNWRTGHPATDRLFGEVVDRLRSHGLSVVDRELALPDKQVFKDEGDVLFGELLDDLDAYLAGRPGEGVHSLADVIAFEDEHVDEEQPFFGHENFITASLSGGRTGDAYKEARPRNLTWAIETCLEPALDGVDVVIAPAFGPSWKSDLTVGGHPGPSSPSTMASAIAGWPILCLPFGVVDGLPVGLSVIGRAHDEWTVIEAARQIETILWGATPWPEPRWHAPTRG